MLHASEELGGEEVAKGGARFVELSCVRLCLTRVILLFNKGDNFWFSCVNTK